MTLRDIYGDVYRRVNEFAQLSEIYHADYLNAINDAITIKRREFVVAGQASQITTREALYFSVPDYYYPFTQSVDLSGTIMKDFPVSMMVVAAMVYRHPEISNIVRSYAVDQDLKKGLVLYKNDQLITALNSYNLTYDPKIVRNYKRGNERVYKAGDIIKDQDTDYIYSVIADFTSDASENVPASNANLTRLYWRETGPSFIIPSFKSFDQLDELPLFSDMSRSAAFAIKGSTVYVSDNVKFMTLDYVAEWVPVTELEDEIDLPGTLVVAVKDLAVNMIRQKFVTKAANE